MKVSCSLRHRDLSSQGPVPQYLSKLSAADLETVARFYQESRSHQATLCLWGSSEIKLGSQSAGQSGSVTVTRVGYSMAIAGQVHSDKAGLGSSWEVSLLLRVWILGVHGQAQAWLWLSWRLVLLQHSSGKDWQPRAELKWGSCVHGQGCR